MEGVGLQDCTVLRMDISGFTAVISINSTDKMEGLHPRPVDVTFPLVVCAVLLGWIPLYNAQDFFYGYPRTFIHGDFEQKNVLKHYHLATKITTQLGQTRNSKARV